MSVKYPRASFVPSTLVDVAKRCTHISETYGPQGRTVSDPIYFYQITDTEVVIPYQLPFSYGVVQHPNTSIQYPVSTYSFTASLIKEQPQLVHEAIGHLNQTGSVLLHLPPGTGKTAISAYLGAMYTGIMLVIFTQSDLIKSWYNTFKQFTTAKVWVVDEKEYPVPTEVNVIICMRDRIDKIGEQLLNAVRILVLDEAHLLCTSMGVKDFLKVTPRYIIACTATPDKANGMESILYQMVNPKSVVYRPNLKHGIIRKHLTKIEHKTEPNPTGKGINWTAFIQEIITNRERNLQIVTICKQNPEHKIMILTARVDHAETLYEMLLEDKQDVQILRAKNSKKRGGTAEPKGPRGGKKQTKIKNSRIIVAGIRKAGTGFDLRMYVEDFDGIEISMVILGTPYKSHTELEQNVGRARDLNPIIYDLVDANDKTHKHWTERCKWYRSQVNFVIQE